MGYAFTFNDLDNPSGQPTVPSKCRGFGISPDGQRICGTFVDPQDVAHWWTGVPVVPDQFDLWTFTQGPAAGGHSGRTINDYGDLAGFSGSEGLMTPMFAPAGANAANFVFDAANPTKKGAIYGIDNARNVVGQFYLAADNPLYPDWPLDKAIGFKVNARAPSAHTNPQLVEDLWSAGHPNSLALRGLNAYGDLVGDISSGEGNGEGFLLLDPGSAHERYINVRAHPLLSGLPTRVAISGINSRREFVGWHTVGDPSVAVQHGLYGWLTASGEIGALFNVDHPGPVPPGTSPASGTQLFGISEAGFMIGTYNNNIPFLSHGYHWDPGPKTPHPDLDDLLELLVERFGVGGRRPGGQHDADSVLRRHRRA